MTKAPEHRSARPAPVADSHDPEVFRRQGHAVIDLLADHLAAMQAAEHGAAVQRWRDPEAMLEAWAPIGSEPAATALPTMLARVVDESIHQHHPRYLGYQISTPFPAAVLADTVASLLNNGMASYDSGPVSTVLERRLIQWMAAQLGYPESADGVFTSGGTLGNLTALLAARQAQSEGDAWTAGADGRELAVIVSDQAHYSVARAVGIMGWGAEGVVTVPADDHFRLRADGIAAGLREADRRGRRALAVVASAGTTPTGAFDPMPELADACESEGLWLHVDGAHGAAAALSPAHRGLVEGIERAHSVVWDAHKLLSMPALCTALLFRDGERSYEVFEQKASYLFAPGDAREQWYNAALRTVECTKTMMALKLYATAQHLGTRGLAEHVARLFGLGARMAARLRAQAHMEVPAEPPCNIVCFRYLPPGTEDPDALQLAIRERLIRAGTFFLARTQLRGRIHLRCTLMNPGITDADLDALVAEVVSAARPE